jgi:hypothetical protein
MREALQLLSLAHTCGVQINCKACPVVLDATRAVEIGTCADNIAPDFPARMAAKGWGVEVIDGRDFTPEQHDEAQCLAVI